MGLWAIKVEAAAFKGQMRGYAKAEIRNDTQGETEARQAIRIWPISRIGKEGGI